MSRPVRLHHNFDRFECGPGWGRKGCWDQKMSLDQGETMDPSLIEMVTRVVTNARRAGLEVQDQHDAAVAAVWAATPGESPAIAHLMVQLLYPRLMGAAA